jgi:hypothetical protein
MQIRRFAMKSRAPAFILVSDLDHTMVQNEDPEHHSLLNFNRLWCRSGLAIDSMLVFSTGRSPTLYRELWVRVIVCLFCTHVLHEWLDSPTGGVSVYLRVPEPTKAQPPNRARRRC